jgi:NADPH2:quinone reductase
VHAIRQHEHGGPEVLRYEEVPDPRPGPGQVRISVEASGVHLLDASIRAGTSFGPMAPPVLPMTPGREVAGVVDEVGPAADAAWLGRRVVVHLGPASGGYAELAVADQDALFALPDHVDATDAVAMVGTGRTALGILEAAQITPEDVVLVTAAAGGLGALLVQAARAAQAFVVGAAGGPDKVQLVKELGADLAVDYADAGWADRVRAGLDGRAITLALDGVGGAIGRTAFELVAPGGRMWLYGYSSGEQMPLSVDDLFATSVTISAAIGPRMLNRPGGIRALAAEALEHLADGRWRPLVNPPFPLADAAEAHRALESRRTVGKVVLVP